VEQLGIGVARANATVWVAGVHTGLEVARHEGVQSVVSTQDLVAYIHDYVEISGEDRPMGLPHCCCVSRAAYESRAALTAESLAHQISGVLHQQ